MHIRKAHILIRHFFIFKDDSAGIFFAEEWGGLLWSAIEQTNDVQEFRRLAGHFFQETPDTAQIEDIVAMASDIQPLRVHLRRLLYLEF